MKQGNHSGGDSAGKSHTNTGHGGEGKDRRLHNPIEDRLIPLEPLDLGKVKSIDDLVRAMSKTAFTGRQLGEAADVLEAMARDEECFVVMTLSGAMTVAKQGLIVTELIDRGIVNAVVSTGALMAHGLVEATGRAHFRHNPEVSDEELYEQGYNRVYDTLEPEQNLDDVEEVMSAVLEGWDHNEVMCSYKLNHAIGAYLAKNAQGSAWDFEIGAREWRAGVCAGIQRFGDGTRHGTEQPSAGINRQAQDSIRSVRRSGTFCGDASAPEEAWDSDHRRWRAAQLVAAVWSVLRAAAPAPWRECGLKALSLRPAHLSRAGLLGRPVRQSVQRGGLLGEVRASVRGGQIWGSFCGCDRWVALDCCGGARAPG